MTLDVNYTGYRPGALADVLGLHIDYYHRHWNFDLPFEVKVASELAEFLGRIDEERDMFLSAYASDGQLLGSITIDACRAQSDGAHLRWFIVSAEASGQGIGQALISRAIAHCDHRKFKKIYLTTFSGLDPARKLYDRCGFKLESEHAEDQWNGGVTEQKFVRVFAEQKLVE